MHTYHTCTHTTHAHIWHTHTHAHTCTHMYTHTHTHTQGIESVFDIMDMEDENRNALLQLTDAQMQVNKIVIRPFIWPDQNLIMSDQKRGSGKVCATIDQFDLTLCDYHRINLLMHLDFFLTSISLFRMLQGSATATPTLT